MWYALLFGLLVLCDLEICLKARFVGLLVRKMFNDCAN